jgi:hypothetical protein
MLDLVTRRDFIQRGIAALTVAGQARVWSAPALVTKEPEYALQFRALGQTFLVEKIVLGFASHFESLPGLQSSSCYATFEGVCGPSNACTAVMQQYGDLLRQSSRPEPWYFRLQLVDGPQWFRIPRPILTVAGHSTVTGDMTHCAKLHLEWREWANDERYLLRLCDEAEAMRGYAIAETPDTNQC